MRPASWRSGSVAGVIVALLLGGAYAVWSTRDRESASEAGWLNSLKSVQGEWVSSVGFAYDGTEPWTAPVRLTVSGDELRLHAGCNHLRAEVTIKDHRVSATSGIVTTEIGCTPELAARDGWLVALLEDHATVQLKGSTDGPMLALDTNAGWIGFIRSSPVGDF